MEKLTVVKIGGALLDDTAQLDTFLKNFSDIEGKKILIHGGGRAATILAERLGHEQKMHEGKRITDAATLDIVTMVYAGLINKTLVAKLQKSGLKAAGFSGADCNLIVAKKRNPEPVDYGFAGDVESVNRRQLEDFLLSGLVPVFCSITHDGSGGLLNTNADTIASAIAAELSCRYEVYLHFCLEKAGVLLNTNDENSLVEILNQEMYEDLKAKKTIKDGMIPKTERAFQAIKKGVKEVIIGSGFNYTWPFTGTRITL